MNKQEILKLIIEQIQTNLEVLITSAQEAKEASTSPESKAENKYDTRGLEASYLAGAQAKRAQEFKEVLFKINKVQLKEYHPEMPIGISALVELLINDEHRRWIFILPVSASSVNYNGQKVDVVTLDAPLGLALLNLKAGAEFSFNNRDYEVLQVL